MIRDLVDLRTQGVSQLVGPKDFLVLARESGRHLDLPFGDPVALSWFVVSSWSLRHVLNEM